MPDAIPVTTLPICPGLGQVQDYAGLHTVACLVRQMLSKFPAAHHNHIIFYT